MTTSLKAVNRISITEQVYRRLRNAIIPGELPQGARLITAHILTLLGSQ